VTHAHEGRSGPLEAPGVPAKEGLDLADAEEQLAASPEDKVNRTERGEIPPEQQV